MRNWYFRKEIFDKGNWECWLYIDEFKEHVLTFDFWLTDWLMIINFVMQSTSDKGEKTKYGMGIAVESTNAFLLWRS